jgi:regulator of sigma E protease
MAIISAGVTMNIFFGFACFVFVYMTHGENRRVGVIDSVVPGSPAWQYGVRSGDVVRQIGSKKDPYFDDFTLIVMNSLEGEKLDLVLERPESPQNRFLEMQIEPQQIEQDIKPTIGVRFPYQLKLPPTRDKDEPPFPVRFNSAAAKAEPPFQFGDEIVGTTDPAHADNLQEILPLPRDPRWLDVPDQRDYFEFRKRLRQLAGKEMVIQVRRQKSQEVENIKVPAAYRWVIPGLRMQMGEIVALRHESPAAKAGIMEHDIIQSIEVKDSHNQSIRYSYYSEDTAPNVIIKPLDPEKIPFELAKWAATAPTSPAIYLTVLRGQETQRFRLEWDDTWRFNDESTAGGRWSVSIPGLGLAYQINTTVAQVEPGSEAEGKGIRPNDVINACRFYKVGRKGTDDPKVGPWNKLKPDEWAIVPVHCQVAEIKEVILRLERENLEIPLQLGQDKDWEVDDRGLEFIGDWRLRKADNIGDALAVGSRRTLDFIIGIYGNLRGLVTQRVSTDAMTGPLGLAEAAYLLADQDFFQYIIFLGIISLNLAIVNFLPIPVLDGGHMAFLIYEKLMSRPASRQVRIATTYLGLAMILSLMGFVIYLDLKRKFITG